MPRRPLEKASRKLPAFVLLASVWALCGVSEAASLAVGATVAPYARLEAASAPGSLVVTRADVQRGWVLAAAPLTLAVRTNSRDGYRIDFRFVGTFVTAARLAANGERWEISPDAPALARSSDGPTRETLQLDVRFALAPDTAPGVYYWPLEVGSATATGAR